MALAVAASASPGTEIVAVDAMQVYRGMDIGTAKPTAGRAGRGAATTASTCVDPADDFTVAELPGGRTTRRSTDDRRAAPRPLLVAGTGLYLHAP